MKKIATVLVVTLLAACGGGESVQGTVKPLAAEPVVTVAPAYEAAGDPSGPTVIVLATNMHDTLDPRQDAVTGGVSGHLERAGFNVVSVDLPCHGADGTPDVSPLSCWAIRISSGDDQLFTRFCASLSALLDSLNIKDANIVGISRGGYVAVTCAAYDGRFKNLGLIVPVTDLNYLTEFKGYPVDVSRFNIQQYIPYVADRPILVRIGDADTRVGTTLAVQFANDSGATLELLDTIGHSAPEDGSTINWLDEELQAEAR